LQDVVEIEDEVRESESKLQRRIPRKKGESFGSNETTMRRSPQNFPKPRAQSHKSSPVRYRYRSRVADDVPKSVRVGAVRKSSPTKNQSTRVVGSDSEESDTRPWSLQWLKDFTTGTRIKASRSQLLETLRRVPDHHRADFANSFCVSHGLLACREFLLLSLFEPPLHEQLDTLMELLSILCRILQDTITVDTTEAVCLCNLLWCITRIDSKHPKDPLLKPEVITLAFNCWEKLNKLISLSNKA